MLDPNPDYALIALMVLIAVGVAGLILILTHLIGPRRYGEIKHGVYESGVDPIGDTSRRFNVRFYLIAVMFLLLDVEIIFLYPWAALFHNVRETADEATPAYIATMQQMGYDSTYLIGAAALFFGLLLVGFVYEWRKGIFRWD